MGSTIEVEDKKVMEAWEVVVLHANKNNVRGWAKLPHMVTSLDLCRAGSCVHQTRGPAKEKNWPAGPGVVPSPVPHPCKASGWAGSDQAA